MNFNNLKLINYYYLLIYLIINFCKIILLNYLKTLFIINKL